MLLTEEQARQRDERAARRQERARRLEEQRVRWRWPWTALLLFNIGTALTEASQKRAQWPGLFSTHVLTRFADFNSVEWNVFMIFVMSFILVQTWQLVYKHRQEEARAEQERLRRSEAREVTTWPPPPTPPGA